MTSTRSAAEATSPRASATDWPAALAAAAVQLVQAGFVYQPYGAYVVVLREQFGWSASLLSAGFAMLRLESGLLGPLQGAWIDRFGAGRILLAGAWLSGVGLILLSLVDSVALYLAAMALIALGTSLAGFLTLSTIVVTRFDQRRTLALGVVGTGFSAAALLVPVVVWGFEVIGWRLTAVVSAAVVTLGGSILAGVLGRRVSHATPSKAGGARFGLAPGAATILRSQTFWLLSLGQASGVLVVSALVVHLIALLQASLAMSLQTASGILVVVTVAQLTGQLGGSWWADHIDRRRLAAVCMLLHGAGLLLLAFPSGEAGAVVFAIGHGLAWGTRGPLTQSLRADLFGKARFASLAGYSSLVVTVGAIGGPVVAGVLFDATGSYTPGLVTLAALSLAGAVCFALLRRPTGTG